jgi:hypothetical protein
MYGINISLFGCEWDNITAMANNDIGPHSFECGRHVEVEQVTHMALLGQKEEHVCCEEKSTDRTLCSVLGLFRSSA